MDARKRAYGSIRATCWNARSYGRMASLARLPLAEREDIGDFAALVRPGIDGPELVGPTIPDHRGVVRTLGQQKPGRGRGNGMVPQQLELVENEQQRIRVVGRVDAIELSAIDKLMGAAAV
jgi:hypothetical protein